MTMYIHLDLKKRLKEVSEVLALTRAKKESLKSQRKSNLEERQALQTRCDTLSHEAMASQQGLQYWKVKAEEAINTLKEIRSSHSAEIRLLQTALLAGSGSKGGASKFKLSDTAELVERLGRAVLQRDQSLKSV